MYLCARQRTLDFLRECSGCGNSPRRFRRGAGYGLWAALAGGGVFGFGGFKVHRHWALGAFVEDLAQEIGEHGDNPRVGEKDVMLSK